MTEQSATDPLPTKPPHRQSVQISCDSDQARTHQKRRLATLHRTHKSQISIASTLDPAGSFFGDFRTPAGVRNSSRKRKLRLRFSMTGIGPKPDLIITPSPELRFEAADAPFRFRAGIRPTEIVSSYTVICARGQLARTANPQYEAICFSTCPDQQSEMATRSNRRFDIACVRDLD